MFYAVCFILGASIASFLGVLIYRYEHNKPLTGRSKCENCNITLHSKYLIPVVGYAISAGKCPSCDYRIPAIYPLSELLLGASFVLMCYLDTPVLHIAFFIALSYWTLYDIWYMKVPRMTTNILVLIFILIGILLHIGDLNFLIILILIFIFLISVFVKWFGMGDVLVILAGYFVLPTQQFVSWVWLSILLGGIYSFGLLIYKKNIKGLKIPFIPFLWLGFIVSFFVNSYLLLGFIFNAFCLFYGILY